MLNSYPASPERRGRCRPPPRIGRDGRRRPRDTGSIRHHPALSQAGRLRPRYTGADPRQPPDFGRLCCFCGCYVRGCRWVARPSSALQPPPAALWAGEVGAQGCARPPGRRAGRTRGRETQKSHAQLPKPDCAPAVWEIEHDYRAQLPERSPGDRIWEVEQVFRRPPAPPAHRFSGVACRTHTTRAAEPSEHWVCDASAPRSRRTPAPRPPQHKARPAAAASRRRLRYPLRPCTPTDRNSRSDRFRRGGRPRPRYMGSIQHTPAISRG